MPLFFGLLTTLGILITFGRDSLFRGQVIKQFEAYSIAESLSHHPVGILSTTIPCDGGIPWTLEPPVFHELGALGIICFPNYPALIPILIAVLLYLSIYRFLGLSALSENEKGMTTLLVCTTPAFLRFGIQFIPDVLALVFLLLGIDLYLRKRKSAFLYLPLAVLTKALMLPAVAMVLFFEECRHRVPSYPRLFRNLALIVAPFWIWVICLKVEGTSSVLNQGGLLKNFLFHGMDILLQPTFYAKFMLWIFIKGCGWIMAIAFGGWVYRRTVSNDWGKRPLFERRLFFWSLGAIPYWLFIRQGNRVHDYYSLSFILPVSLLGSVTLIKLFRHSLSLKTLVGASALISILLGVQSLRSMAAIPHGLGSPRPQFCGDEMRPPSLRHKGAYPTEALFPRKPQ